MDTPITASSTVTADWKVNWVKLYQLIINALPATTSGTKREMLDINKGAYDPELVDEKGNHLPIMVDIGAMKTQMRIWEVFANHEAFTDLKLKNAGDVLARFKDIPETFEILEKQYSDRGIIKVVPYIVPKGYQVTVATASDRAGRASLTNRLFKL